MASKPETIIEESEDYSDEAFSPLGNSENFDVSGVNIGITSKKRKRENTDESEEEDAESEEKRLLANSQERCRMRKLNIALDLLRRSIPKSYYPHHRRLSKIRTLTSAKHYIQKLTDLLKQPPVPEETQCEQTTRVPMSNTNRNLTSPEQAFYPAMMPHSENGTNFFQAPIPRPNFMSTPYGGYRIPHIRSTAEYSHTMQPMTFDFDFGHGQSGFSSLSISGTNNESNSSISDRTSPDSSGSSGYYTDSPGCGAFWEQTDQARVQHPGTFKILHLPQY